MASTRIHDASKKLGVLLITTLVLCSGSVGAGVVSAQESAPGEPVNFYGQITDNADTPAPAGTEVYAVVNGSVEDRMTISEAGQYGGPGAFDDKLTVNSAAGDEIHFRIASPDGPEAVGSPYELSGQSGVIELNLTFSDETFDGPPGDGDGGTDGGDGAGGSGSGGGSDGGGSDGGGSDGGGSDGGDGSDGGGADGGDGSGGDSDTGAPSFVVSELDPQDVTISAGDALTVTATIENVGDTEGTQSVEYRIGGAVMANQSVLLAPGETTTVEFADIETLNLETDEYEHGVFTENDSQTATLTIGGGSDGTNNSTPGFGYVASLLALLLFVLGVRRKRD
ncbi:CARDB domain-containing protein [Halorubrum sp. RMP-47]|uniref:CARDB domain-containing protein n=1 Tax=Halorubrum miltondacostae TaxID=3076378 RepID=A0ABD5M2U6_9EURY